MKKFTAVVLAVVLLAGGVSSTLAEDKSKIPDLVKDLREKDDSGRLNATLELGKLGKEVPLGTGAVNFPVFLAELKRLNYAGPLIIERESGPNVRAEIRQARQYLQGLLCG